MSDVEWFRATQGRHAHAWANGEIRNTACGTHLLRSDKPGKHKCRNCLRKLGKLGPVPRVKAAQTYRAHVRKTVEKLLARAKKRGASAREVRLAIAAAMDGVLPKTRKRRLWLTELRRAGAPIREIPDFRQLGFDFGVAS